MAEWRTNPFRYAALLVAALCGLVACETTVETAAPPTAWHDPDKISDFRVGIFCKEGRIVASAANQTIKGSVDRFANKKRVPFARATQRIPAVDQLLFGVEGRETPPSPDVVTITVKHPALGPQKVVRESWTTNMEGNRVTFHGYYLGLADGNPEGQWTIEGTRAGELLFEAKFNVVPPRQGDQIICK